MQILYCVLEIIFLPVSHMTNGYSVLIINYKGLLFITVHKPSKHNRYLSFLQVAINSLYSSTCCHSIQYCSSFYPHLKPASVWYFQISSIINHNLTSNVALCFSSYIISKQLVYFEGFVILMKHLGINQTADNMSCIVKQVMTTETWCI